MRILLCEKTDKKARKTWDDICLDMVDVLDPDIFFICYVSTF